MSTPQSATAPAIFILGGLVLFFFIPALGLLALLIGGILLVVRIVAGTANAVSEQNAGPSSARAPQIASSAETPAAPLDREHLMKQFGITFDGERYHYREYRYEKLEDAVSYAIRTQNRA